MRRDVTFRSEGADLAGWLYLPDVAPPWPLVVMAHGFSATRHMTADKYAEAFRDAGIAALLYDHHGFGQSGGEPRQQINNWLQARGYRDGLAFATTLPEIDPTRIALWGDSLSAAVALAVASLEPRVAALVAQVPALGAMMPPRDRDGALCQLMHDTILGGAIAASPALCYGPMPVVSESQRRRRSALTPVTAYRWFTEYGGREGTGWVNDITGALPDTPVAWHAGLCAKRVTCPSLFMVSPIDEMIGARPAVARRAFEELAGPKQWVEVDGGHFGLLYHPSPLFDHASAIQARFLAEHLRAGR